eukprot:291070-Rhodomonas_salina.4
MSVPALSLCCVSTSTPLCQYRTWPRLCDMNTVHRLGLRYVSTGCGLALRYVNTRHRLGLGYVSTGHGRGLT